jgi:hypothetical protein
VDTSEFRFVDFFYPITHLYSIISDTIYIPLYKTFSYLCNELQQLERIQKRSGLLLVSPPAWATEHVPNPSAAATHPSHALPCCRPSGSPGSREAHRERGGGVFPSFFVVVGGGCGRFDPLSSLAGDKRLRGVCSGSL